MTAADEFARANEPWDGRWFVPLPEGAGPRFYTLEQFTARQLLRDRAGLTNWGAKLCQIIATQEAPLSDLQRHWLQRLCREHDERFAA